MAKSHSTFLGEYMAQFFIQSTSGLHFKVEAVNHRSAALTAAIKLHGERVRAVRTLDGVGDHVTGNYQAFTDYNWQEPVGKQFYLWEM